MGFDLFIAIIGGIILWIAAVSERKGKRGRAEALRDFYRDL